MEQATAHLAQMATTSKHFVRRLLTIGENRLELLMVEVQEERERLLHAILLALGVAVFGLLAGITLTGHHRGLVVGLLTRGRPPDIDRSLWSRRGLSWPATHRTAA